MSAIGRCVRTSLVAAAVAALAWVGATASETAKAPSFWAGLPEGTIKLECDGETAGLPARIATAAGSWVDAAGVVTCRDLGDSYGYEVEFVRLEINPERRGDIERDALTFDWLGLAAFALRGDGVEWLYDEAQPVQGTLRKAGTDKIYLGRLTFRIDKVVLGKADRLLFYLTARGVAIRMGVL